MENFGVEFGVQDSTVFDAGLSDTLGNGFVGLDNVAGQLLSDLGVGRASPGGLILSAGDESFNFILRFLEQKGCAKVLFRPHVMTLENLTGRFTSGQQIQRLGQINNVGLGNTQQSIDNVDVGVNLSVTPRVSPDGMIVMFVDVANTSLGNAADGTVIAVDQAGNPIQSAPIIQTGVQTAVMCRSGQTIAITGLISEQKTETVSSIPILGKLPVIGPLFQNTLNDASRSETLIILTPYIVNGEDDLNFMNEDEFERMHWCRCDVAEAYGSTDYVGTPYFEQTPAIYRPDDDPTGRQPANQNNDSFRQPVQDQFPGRFDNTIAPQPILNPQNNATRGINTTPRELPQPIENAVPANPQNYPAGEGFRPVDGSSSRNRIPNDRSSAQLGSNNQPMRFSDNRLPEHHQGYGPAHPQVNPSSYRGGGPVNERIRDYPPTPQPAGQPGYSGQANPSSNQSMMPDPRQWDVQDVPGRNFTLHPRNNEQNVYR